MTKKLFGIALLSLVAFGCNNGQDVGDANKTPAPGTVSAPGSPAGGPTGGAPASAPTMAAPKTPQ